LEKKNATQTPLTSNEKENPIYLGEKKGRHGLEGVKKRRRPQSVRNKGGKNPEDPIIMGGESAVDEPDCGKGPPGEDQALGVFLRGKSGVKSLLKGGNMRGTSRLNGNENAQTSELKGGRN